MCVKAEFLSSPGNLIRLHMYNTQHKSPGELNIYYASFPSFFFLIQYVRSQTHREKDGDEQKQQQDKKKNM
jgi:hypothetical protein